MQIKNKFSGEVIAEYPETKLEEVSKIIERSRRGFEEIRAMPHFQRYENLLNVAKVLNQDESTFSRIITEESGKPIKYARREVERASLTLLFSAEESKRIHGETVPMDVEEAGINRFAYYTREPKGQVLAITPFNDPLNLVAHKLGPALAAGNSVINKPSTMTPISAVNLREAIIRSGFSEDAVQTIIATGGGRVTKSLLDSDEIRHVTFTGGIEAGKKLMATGKIKKFSMELGGNSPVIVWNDADLDTAAASIVEGAFESQGQNCIRPQRVLIKDDVYDYLKNRISEISSKLTMGDPMNEETDIGPMISEQEASRVESEVKEAIQKGAAMILGGEREGSFMKPTLLELSDTLSPIWRNEIFGPVLLLKRVGSFEEAIDLSNNVDYGLQAGIFTSDLDLAMTAVDRLEYGTVLINDTSNFRIDSMPFGGLKNSSIGREGIRFAMDEFMEMKLVIVKR